MAEAAKKTATPRYIIRDTIFLNYRYIMASASNPVLIETVARPNPDWEPANQAARDQLKSHTERVQKVIKEGEVGTSAHEAVRKMKRSVAKFDGTPFEDIPEEVEPQDAAYAGVVVHQPRDTVAALRAAGAPQKMDRVVQAQEPLSGEPPEDQTTTAEEPSPEGEEQPPTPEQQEEEDRVAAQESGELTESSDTASIPVQTSK